METQLLNEKLICDNLTLNGDKLIFAGVDTEYLAKKYGTPLYIMDENRIRNRIRTYKKAVSEAFPDGGGIFYASKAASFKEIYRIAKDEKIGSDVVSCGEIHTADAAGFPLENTMFHSNNKTDADIEYAIEHGVGYFATDNVEELYAIERIAGFHGIIQSVLLRITPGIDPHTYAAISTGKVDSKFGSAIETGQAEEITKIAISLPHIRLEGFHCHIGSQVFDSGVYFAAAEKMLGFIADIKHKLGYEAKMLDLGGGYGVRYTEKQPKIDIAANIKEVGRYVTELCQRLGINVPKIYFEPGRSIVADAGLSLYTVGTVKTIPGYKTYVSVDGGMTDNIRFALYGAPYTLLCANKMTHPCAMTASVVGRCCESGDIIQNGVPLPSDICRGDLIATLTTGAYHYSMASNYNRIPRPPIVMLCDGYDRLAVRRETIDDICALDE